MHRFSPSVHKTAQLLHQWHLADDDPETQTLILEAKFNTRLVGRDVLLKNKCRCGIQWKALFNRCGIQGPFVHEKQIDSYLFLVQMPKWGMI